ncbi:MAG: hypothetical protein QXF42_08235 [Sulfolobales archaeon]
MTLQPSIKPVKKLPGTTFSSRDLTSNTIISNGLLLLKSLNDLDILNSNSNFSLTLPNSSITTSKSKSLGLFEKVLLPKITKAFNTLLKDLRTSVTLYNTSSSKIIPHHLNDLLS